MKCWFLDETQEPEEKPLTAEQRREPYNKLIPHNRELMQLITTEQNKNSALAVQFLVHFFSRHETNTTWNFTFIKEVNTSRRLSFPFSELTWRRTILFAASERVNGGDRKREFLSVAKQTPYFRSILFITITKFSNLIGYQLSWFQQSRSV